MKLKIVLIVLIVLLIIAPIVFATINVSINLNKPVSDEVAALVDNTSDTAYIQTNLLKEGAEKCLKYQYGF